MALSYRINFSQGAFRQLQKLPHHIQKRLARRIDALAANPRPENAAKLAGEKNGYRIRVGDFRVLYEIRDKILVVLVVRIAHRKEAYKRLPELF